MGEFGFSGKLLGIDYALLPNREWNQKQKHKKNSLGATWNASHLAVRLCALRHWKRVSMPPTTQSLRHPLTRAFPFAPRIKTVRRFTAKNPWKLWFVSMRQCQNDKPKGRFFWFVRNVCFMFQSPQYLSKESEFGWFWLNGVKFGVFMLEKYVI